MALAARSIAYGEKIVYSGPMYHSMKVEGDKIRLMFNHVGGGLMAKGGDTLKGFAIAGADQLKIGHGHGPLHHFHDYWRTS